MIISASRRTDILAFHKEWLDTAFEQGFVEVSNPFNLKQKKLVSLKREEVTAFVFWTRNPLPSIDILKWLEETGFPFYLMVTFTNYPKIIEGNVPDLETSRRIFKRLSALFGRERIILRYDPILISNLTGARFHEDNFELICRTLSPFTGRVITSLFDPYKFALKRMDRLDDFKLIDFGDDGLVELLSKLKAITDKYSLELQSCCEGEAFEKAGIKQGACIDVDLLNKLFRLDLKHEKDTNQRDNCLCSKSVDIGSYNTCPAGCAYCYANK
jgi:hypothetical protein